MVTSPGNFPHSSSFVQDSHRRCALPLMWTPTLELNEWRDCLKATSATRTFFNQTLPRYLKKWNIEIPTEDFHTNTQPQNGWGFLTFWLFFALDFFHCQIPGLPNRSILPFSSSTMAHSSTCPKMWQDKMLRPADSWGFLRLSRLKAKSNLNYGRSIETTRIRRRRPILYHGP